MKARFLSALFLAATLGIARLFAADPANVGTITGHVFNPATGEFVRNAQVQVRGASELAVTGDGGEFVIRGVPAGPAQVTVTFTGYRNATATVLVPAGGTVSQDFDIVSQLARPDDAGVLKLSEFVVTSDREGNAKAIMDQKRSMNITNTVASDAFGENPEGNVAEFIKYLPGVELESFFGEIRNVRLRGLSSEYNAVTLDGMSLASADANNGVSVSGTRAFSFEQVSLSSIDSIELNKTISADVEANAPAGTINLRTKRAFDRKGRRVVLEANVSGHSEALSLGSTYGPDEKRHRKIRPGGMIEYSDIFLNKRLGLVLNISESNVYQNTERVRIQDPNRTTTSADARGQVMTSFETLQAARFNEKFSTTLTLDFKATPSLSFGLTSIYNYNDLWNPQRAVRWVAGSRAGVQGNPELTSFTSGPDGSVVFFGANVAKIGETVTFLPNFEYRLGALRVEGKFASSSSVSRYAPLVHRHSLRDLNSATDRNVVFHAERTSAAALDWKISQLGGPDWASPNSFTSSPNATLEDGRYTKNSIFIGDLNATLDTRRWLPVQWKGGLRSKYERRNFRDNTVEYRASYTGTDPRDVWAPKSPYVYNMNMLHGSIVSSSGGTLYVPDLSAMGEEYLQNPALFQVPAAAPATAANDYYNVNIANRRKYTERIDAGFFMATSTIKRLTLRAGLRDESTNVEVPDYQVVTPADVRAAGFTTGTSGRANTIAGLQYQYFSKPMIKRTRSYSNLFPSASLKYRLTSNLDLQAGYSTTIRRPSANDIATAWTYDETNSVIRAPNPQLKPEYDRNYATRLAYYFEPVGIVAINFFESVVSNMITGRRYTAEEFGLVPDPVTFPYQFVDTASNAPRRKIKGLELEYSQSLSFLPRPFNGLSVRGSYTRTYQNNSITDYAPRTASGGLRYKLGRFGVGLSTNWSDDVPINSQSRNEVRRHRWTLDGDATYSFARTWRVAFNIRNITNSPYAIDKFFGVNPRYISEYQVVGATWTFSVIDTF